MPSRMSVKSLRARPLRRQVPSCCKLMQLSHTHLPESSRVTSKSLSSCLHVALAASLLVLSPTAKAQRPLGIDVSSYQGAGVNWSSVKSSGRTFAWTKATEGTGYQDADFAINENNGKAAGVYMGAYHYAHPELNTASSEASYFWNFAHAYILADGLTLGPMLDIEGSAFNGNVGATSTSDWINQWCTDVVQDAANNGVALKPAIYISACNASHLNSSVAQWGSDIADYNGEDPQTGTPWSACAGDDVWGSGVWHFWQYSSTVSVPGVSGNCDVDVFNGTAAQLVSGWVATASTNSTIYYWDPQNISGGNPYTGSMSGTWENAKWSYGSTGLSSPVNWVDGKAACFGVHTGNGTPAYTVTMNSGHVVAGFFDGALAPNSCDITIQGSGTIDLASGAQALDSIKASDGSVGQLRINVAIAGAGQLFPEGNANSYLHGTNSYSGGTQLGYSTVSFSGIVYFNNPYAFGTGQITLWNHGNGGALVLEGTSAVTLTNPVSVASGCTNNIVGNGAGLTFSGDWGMGANLLALGTGATAGNQTIISGVVSGTAGLVVYNSGTLVLNGVNTYSGNTTIASPAIVTIGGAGQLGSGAYGNSIINNGTFNYNSTASQTISGVISGSGPVKTLNGGTLVLTAPNTYTGGTTVGSGSTLCVTADSALGTAAGALALNGGCLKNNNSSPTITTSRTLTLGASGGYLDAGWAPSHPLTINALITGSGALLIDLDGSPVVLANAANNYTGNTVIGTNGPGYYAPGSLAWLKLGASGVIPNGSGKGNVIINQAYSGLLDLAGFNQTINGLIGDGVVTNSTGSATISVGNNNQTSTFNGLFRSGAGTLALTKVGSGSLTLGGANTYTGNTTISAGTLALGSNGSISNSAGISIAAGATLDVSALGSFALSSSTTLSASGTASAATINGGAGVDLGSRPITLTFDGLHPALSISQGSLSINGNAFTVNGSALALGTYTILQVASGNVSANGPFPVSGSVIGAGKTGAISVSGGNINLIISEPSTFSNLTASQSVSYGTPTVALSGTVSGAGPVYPANGENVTVTINGNAQLASVTSGNGSFSINYNLAGIPASGAAYPITYSYAGDASLNPTSDSTKSLTITPASLTITSEYMDGTGTNFVITWQSNPGTTYQVIGSSDPAAPLSTWTPVGSPITANSSSTSATNSINQPFGFFNVKSQ
ncbi:MAG: hypothetical protein C5B50_16295 [Verrucomicrobia bacterium]|nr:MAG: hypothetical protein C5B50_16295 [Verrucomicrobiota bacterium]